MESVPGRDDSSGFVTLLAAARSGSADAIGTILEDCRNYLLLIANKDLDPKLRTKTGASDLVQETMFRARKAFDLFHGSEERELLAWLRTILNRRIISLARHWSTQRSDLTKEILLDCPDDSELEPSPIASHQPSPSDRIRKEEEAQAVHEALAQLGEIDQQIVKLYIWEDQSFEQIAQAVGLSESACMKRWQRAIEKLTKTMNAKREA